MCWLCKKSYNKWRAGFCIWEDQAGKIYLCKEHMDMWLDNADEDEQMEPLSLELI
jgi:hypothetical protein